MDLYSVTDYGSRLRITAITLTVTFNGDSDYNIVNCSHILSSNIFYTRMDISNANSDRIYQWVNNESNDSYIKQEFPRGFEQSFVISKNEQKLLKSPHCVLIPHFPLVLKCGDPSCHSCFPVFF